MGRATDGKLTAFRLFCPLRARISRQWGLDRPREIQFELAGFDRLIAVEHMTVPDHSHPEAITGAGVKDSDTSNAAAALSTFSSLF